MTEVFSLLDEALSRSIDAMFCQSNGTSRFADDQAPFPPDEEVVVTTMGFACPQVRGGLTAFTTRKTLRALTPIDLDESEATDCDVLGELANMLLGRVKNQLLGDGFALLLGIPTSVIARDVRLPDSREDERSSWHALHIASATLYVRLNASTIEAASPPLDAPTSAGSEGEMLFF